MLAEQFHKNYFGGDSPAVALNKARSIVCKRLIERDWIDHPFYRAVFVVEGSDIDSGSN